MKISCVVSQAGCVFPLLNGCFIQLFMCLSAGFLHVLLESGSSGWVADLGVFFVLFCFLMGAQCLCSPMFCGERGFIRGGGGRWKRDLMNGDSQNGGCGSLKTQARWIELRLTGNCPLSSYTNMVQLLTACRWCITQAFDLVFSYLNNRFIK